MKKLTSVQVRKMWIDFFTKNNHHFLEPANLIPVEDPSLLWINSGVATLKPYFDGRKVPPSPNLTNSQKSIRTNDIENVGVTARHQTMFEMLGNFSIGGYFKKEAIHMAWELLTKKEWFDMDKDLLYITVFEEDEEAYNIWTKEIGIKEDHIFKGTRDTNFWDVGQGPCGPNTEIFFDRGPKWDPKNIGPKLLKDDIENDRYIEIWNIVFSQFNNDGNNNYTELPRKNIDTGAGLERITSIFQETPTNFETDLFISIIKEVEKICDKNFKYSIDNYFKENTEQTKINTAFKVIADHIRATTFAIADGVYPSNKDRGYIIRRLIRRSSVYGKKLGIQNTFLYLLVDEVIKVMKDFYPYLIEKREMIIDAIKIEEEKFLKTLSKGLDLLESIIEKDKKVTGKNALLLFESFGFPIELTKEISENKKVIVDEKEFEKLLNDAKELARKSRKDGVAWNKQSEILTSLKVKSEFIGYENESCNSKVIFMFKDDKEIKEIKNDTAFVILDKTPFYAEKGGQAADHGTLVINNNVIKVIDTQLGPNNQNIHKVVVSDKLSLNDVVEAQIDSEKRYYTMKNHSGTHLLHSAIREILGNTAMQAGSYNDENGLRIDITFSRAVTKEEIFKINEVCKREINSSTKREVIYTDIKTATEVHNALAFFADKYDDEVRIVKFGKFSCELCGGTHVENTKDIEDLLITSVESKGSGVFRFSAVTSFKTIGSYLDELFAKLKSEVLSIYEKYLASKSVLVNKELEILFEDIKNTKQITENIDLIKAKISKINEMFKNYFKEAEDLMISKKLELYKNLEVKEINNILYLEKEINDLSIKELKVLCDEYKNKYENIIITLVNLQEKVMVVSVSEKISNENKAIYIFKNNKKYKTKGGGNDTFAQGKIE